MSTMQCFFGIRYAKIKIPNVPKNENLGASGTKPRRRRMEKKRKSESANKSDYIASQEVPEMPENLVGYFD